MPQAPGRRAASKAAAVATLVRLHHRRRGWAWVAVGSVVGLAVYAGIDVNLFEKLTGPAETLSALPVLVLLALALAGLVVVAVDSSRIRRADAALRAKAKGRVSHHPVYAHAHRYPPRHHGSWVFAVVMLAAMTGIAVFLLPAQVDSWGFVAGAEHQDTFHPVSYRRACSGVRRAGCRIVTDGYLSVSGQDVVWGSQVPLGQPFPARDPLWAWGSGRTLIDGDPSAVGTIIAGLFFDGVAFLLLYVVGVVVRETSAGRSQTGGPRPGRVHP